MSAEAVVGREGRRFVDTNLLVYAYDEKEGRKQAIAQDVIAGLWRSGAGCLSVQVLQELFVSLTRKVTPPLSIPTATTVIEDFSAWPVHAPGSRDVLSAIELHEREGISFWDAMIVTSARSLGCRVLHSEDLSAGRSYDGVLVVNPFAPDS